MENLSCCGRFFRSLARKKNFQSQKDDLLATKLRRCLTTVDVTLIGISSTLGSGVYILTGEISSKTGMSIVISITLAAIASVLCGLCYTEFAARIPKAGSAYVYSYVVIGEFFAFVVGWNLILEYGIGAASVVKGFTAYVDALTHNKIQNFTISVIGRPKIFGSEVYFDFFSFLTSIIVTFSISLSVKTTSFLNNFCTVVNVIVIVMVVAMGSFYAKAKNIGDFMPNGIHSVIAGSSSCFFAFIGFDAVCMVAEEAKKPNKSIPIGVVGTILTCYICLISAAVVLNMMVPYTKMDGSAALATAFDTVGQHAATYIISIGAIFGLLGCAIASMMMMPRFLYSMAEDGLIFKLFASVHQSTEIPLFSTIFGGLLTGFMTLVLDLHALVDMVSIGTILAYSLVTLSLLIVRYRTDGLGIVRSRSVTSRNMDSQLSGKDPSDIVNNEDSAPNNENFQDSELPVQFPTSTNEDSNGSIGDLSDTSRHDRSPSIHSDDNTEYTHLIINDDNSLTDLIVSWRGRRLKLPTPFTQYVATCCSYLAMVQVICLAAVLHYLSHRLFEGEVAFVIIFIALVLCVFLTTFLISMMPQNNQRLFFKVPLVPWLPVFALFLNVYLMFGLNKLTWIRFGVWMFIGFLVYFVYGYRHSKQGEEDRIKMLQNHED